MSFNVDHSKETIIVRVHPSTTKFQKTKTHLNQDALIRINVPNLSLEVPLGVVGSLERLALLGLAAAPHDHQRIAHALRTGGSEVTPGLYQKRHHVRRLRHAKASAICDTAHDIAN